MEKRAFKDYCSEIGGTPSEALLSKIELDEYEQAQTGILVPSSEVDGSTGQIDSDGNPILIPDNAIQGATVDGIGNTAEKKLVKRQQLKSDAFYQAILKGAIPSTTRLSDFIYSMKENLTDALESQIDDGNDILENINQSVNSTIQEYNNLNSDIQSILENATDSLGVLQ